MTRRPIGYYVHHRGAGHRARARAVASLLDRPCTLIGTLGGCDDGQGAFDRLDLPNDRISSFDGVDGEADRPEAFHYAPLGVAAIRTRMARIAAWVEAKDPVMMIVDVSVEITLLARLLSVPTIVVRLAGNRIDRPHLEAFRSAERLIAPFPAVLESASTPDWVLRKTIHAGFLAAAPPPPIPDAPVAQNRILVLFGGGGEGGSIATLAEAARALPATAWDVLGPVHGDRSSLPPNLAIRGWVSDVDPYLSVASLVIGTGGDGVIAAVAGRGKRFICIPEPRPFDEQRVKAEALQRAGAAIHHATWEGTDWPALVAEGLALDPRRLAGLAQPDAIERLARSIDAVAEAFDGRPDRPAAHA